MRCFKSVMLGSVCLLAFGGTVEASHWCEQLRIATTPTNVLASRDFELAISLENAGQGIMNVSVRARTSWETQSSFVGAALLLPGTAELMSAPKIATDSVGDHFVVLTIQGHASDSNETLALCPTLYRPLRVETWPAGPTVFLDTPVIVTKSPAGLNMTAQVLGGQPPFTFFWAIDGKPGPGSADSLHIWLNESGRHDLRVVVTDALGRTSWDRITLELADSEPRAQRYPAWDVLTWLSGSLLGLLVFGQVVAFLMLARRPRLGAREEETPRSPAAGGGLGPDASVLGSARDVDAPGIHGTASQQPPEASTEPTNGADKPLSRDVISRTKDAEGGLR